MKKIAILLMLFWWWWPPMTAHSSVEQQELPLLMVIVNKPHMLRSADSAVYFPDRNEWKITDRNTVFYYNANDVTVVSIDGEFTVTNGVLMLKPSALDNHGDRRFDTIRMPKSKGVYFVTEKVMNRLAEKYGY